MYTAWRSDGLNTHPGDQMDYAHTAWRSDGLCTQGLEIRWTKHTRSRDLMDYAQTTWRSDGLCTQLGDPMD
jgi:hypothetical protein